MFDLDGTLIDSYQAIRDSVNHVRGLRELPPLDEATVRGAVGNGLTRLLEATVVVGEPADNARAFLAHHEAHLAEGTRLLPGVRDTLARLRQRGARLAVCSNKPVALTQRILDTLGIADWFLVVLGPELVPKQKPAPDMPLAALARMDARADEALYVGDMTIDIVTARSAGIPVWVIASGSHDADTLRAGSPDHIMTDFAELLQATI